MLTTKWVARDSMLVRLRALLTKSSLGTLTSCAPRRALNKAVLGLVTGAGLGARIRVRPGREG